MFWFDQALADYQAEYRDRENHYDPLGIGPMSVPYSVNDRIQWTTPLGTPHVHDQHGTHTFSVYFDR